MYSFIKPQSTLGSSIVHGYMGSKDTIIAFVSGAVILMALPYLHIGVIHLMFWVPGKPEVQKDDCTCSCFDTVFRGTYEEPGAIGYKHVYFNATRQTFKIWILTLMFVLMAYESIRYLIQLLRIRKIRRTMFILYLINIYPHYYSWWSYFSYYNEDFYTYFNHHLWFTFTEIITTCIVLNLCDKRNEIISWKILAIASISVMHILMSGIDQFISDVIYRQGQTFLNARNIALMIPDCLHVTIPAWELYNFAKRRELKFYELCYKEELILCFIFVSMGTVLGHFL